MLSKPQYHDFSHSSLVFFFSKWMEIRRDPGLYSGLEGREKYAKEKHSFTGRVSNINVKIMLVHRPRSVH